MYAWSVYKHAVVAAFHIYAQLGENLLKWEVGGRALNSHGNYNVVHGKIMELFLNICGNPDPDQLASLIWIYIVAKTEYILI